MDKRYTLIINSINKAWRWRVAYNGNNVGNGVDEYWKDEKLDYPEAYAKFSKVSLWYYKKSQDRAFLELTDACLKWLLKNRSKGGNCWGLPFDYKKITKGTPHLVTTSFCSDAFIERYAVDRQAKWLEIAKESIQWALENLSIEGTPGQLYYSTNLKKYIPNANALFLSVLSKYSKYDDEFIGTSNLIANELLKCQNPDGSWYYLPNSQEPYSKWIDTLHTSFMLNGLWSHQNQFKNPNNLDNLILGTDFLLNQLYKPTSYGSERVLFGLSDRDSVGLKRAVLDTATKLANSYGIMKYRNPETRLWGYAASIKALAAAGNIRVAYLERASAIAEYVIKNLQAPEGYFYYRSANRACYIRHQAYMLEAMCVLADRMEVT